MKEHFWLQIAVTATAAGSGPKTFQIENFPLRNTFKTRQSNNYLLLKNISGWNTKTSQLMQKRIRLIIKFVLAKIQILIEKKLVSAVVVVLQLVVFIVSEVFVVISVVLFCQLDFLNLYMPTQMKTDYK